MIRHLFLYMANHTFQEETDKALGIINRSQEEKETIEKAKSIGLSYVNIGKLNINPDLCNIISAEDAKNGLIVPFFISGKKLRVAIYEPALPETNKVLEKLSNENYSLTVGLASKSGIVEALHMYDTKKTIEVEDFVSEIDEVNLDAYDQEISEIFDKLETDVSSLSSAKLLNLILVGAIRTKASDIHFEPEKIGLRIRFRVDGMLRDVFTVPTNKMDDLIKQIKHKSKMKLNVTKRPQDGRFFFVLNGRDIDVRVSALPTPLGEDMVIRILDNKDKDMTLSKLGVNDIAAEILGKAIEKPHGMILTTGPTGSGKTTTLYTLLREMNNSETKIITIEDPIEYKVSDITQSQISEEEGYTFASGLRSILRQDPDIVMVGEIRDLETAQIAAQASLTGHKVLSTLHTNDAVGAIDRLLNMGLESFMIAPAIETIIAQRLVRKTCPHCCKDKAISNEQKIILDKIIERLNTVLKVKVKLPEKIKSVVGCKKCGNTGYLGRVGLYEIVEITEEIREMILQKKSANEIKQIARRNSFSVFEAGVLRVIEGSTTLEEVIRVSKMNE